MKTYHPYRKGISERGLDPPGVYWKPALDDDTTILVIDHDVVPPPEDDEDD